MGTPPSERIGEFYTMAKVRGKGSVVQLDRSVSRAKCKRWQLRVPTGRDLATGRYTSISRNFQGTLTEANGALRELIAEVERDDVQRRSDMRFADYAAAWMREREGKVSAATSMKDKGHIRALEMHLGDARLHEITPEVLEGVYARMMAGESLSGKRLSSNYVAGVATTLHRLFKQAVRDGHIASNPCDLAERPKVVRSERRSIRAEAMRRLMGELDPTDPLQLVIVICLKTGMRRGEAHGLSWGDIDFDAGVIRIRHSLDKAGNLKEPKTSAGRRDIPLPSSLTADLMARRDFQEADFARARRRYGSEHPVMGADAPIVCNGLGERMMPHSSTRWWDRNRKRLGFSGMTLHEMRHSYLSEMARRKVDPKVLQTLAGHAKFATTMDIYTHVDMEDKQRAVDLMDW